MSKLKASQVIEIYKSADTISELAKKFKVGPAEIRKIKHKKSWKSVLAHIKIRPGFHYKNRFEFFNQDELIREITDIYLDDRADATIAKDYYVGIEKIRKIKAGIIYNEITNLLVLPEVSRYSLTITERNYIKNSAIPAAEEARKFGVHVDTIRNIRQRGNYLCSVPGSTQNGPA